MTYRNHAMNHERPVSHVHRLDRARLAAAFGVGYFGEFAASGVTAFGTVAATAYAAWSIWLIAASVSLLLRTRSASLSGDAGRGRMD